MPNVRVRITATGQVLELDIEEYLRCVVPNESPASWPMEELKAQAVAARTYALASSGILYDDERSQVFRQRSQNSHTDEAIRATAGVVGLYQGQIKPMYFSASCGGVTLGTWGPWLKHYEPCPCAAAGYGKNGHQQGMCQQGARILAQQGASYLEILRTYYNMDFPISFPLVPTVSSKLSIQYQGSAEWVKGIHLPWQKQINPGGTDLWPGSHTLGRPYIDDDNAIINNYVRRGAPGADAYFARCLPNYQASPWVYCWEGPNEAQSTGNIAEVQSAAAFWSRWIDLMHNAGLLTAFGSWGVCWPMWGHAVLFRESFQKSDFWTMHEYGAPTLQTNSGEWSLRHRGVIRELRAAGVRVPPLIISEAGIDGGLCNQAGQGWKSFGLSPEQYEQQLMWYDDELKKDSDVVTATIFLACATDIQRWGSFELDEAMCRWLASRYTGGTMTLEQFLGAECQKTIVPLNPNSAFQKYAAPRGWIAVGQPPDVVFEGVTYSMQPYREPGNYGVQHIVYCKTGDWSHVTHFDRPN